MLNRLGKALPTSRQGFTVFPILGANVTVQVLNAPVHAPVQTIKVGGA